MMLQACELGVGSTWVMNFDPKKISEVYSLPQTVIPVALLVCGYPSEGVTINHRHNERKPIEELCRFNTFSMDTPE